MTPHRLTSSILPPLPHALAQEAADQWLDRARDALDLWRLDRRHTPTPDEADAWTAFDLLVSAAALQRLRPDLAGAEREDLLLHLHRLLDASGDDLAALVIKLPLPGDWLDLAQAWQREDSDTLDPDARIERCQLLLSSLDDLELLACTLDTLDPDLGLAFATRLQGLAAPLFDAPWDWLHAPNWLRAQAEAMRPDPEDPALALTQHKFEALLRELEEAYQAPALLDLDLAALAALSQPLPRTPDRPALSTPPRRPPQRRPALPNYTPVAAAAAPPDLLSTFLGQSPSGQRLRWAIPPALGWERASLVLPDPSKASDDTLITLSILGTVQPGTRVRLAGVERPLETHPAGAAATFTLAELRAGWEDAEALLVAVLEEGEEVVLELA